MNSQEYFEQVAAHWDRMRQSFFSENVREVAYATANVQPGRLAADLGAGTGFITEGLVHRGVKVIAVDHSPAMLAELKKKLAASDLVDCRVGEADRLPIAEETVDYVFANMYLHHLESPPDAIREMARVLKPGGRIAITDLDEHTFEFLKTEQHDRWLGFRRDDVRQWLAGAGLREIRVDCASERCCAESSGGREQASVSIFVASGQK